MNAPWLQPSGEDVVLVLHIQPGAKKTEVAGPHGDSLKIRLAAPPVDGRANECLIAFLAATLGIAKARITLLADASSRAKRLRVTGVSAAATEAQLLPPG